jgi:hypothetical protein
MAGTEDAETKRQGLATFFKGYAPAIALVSLFITSLLGYRAYRMNSATTRAYLYVRGVEFVSADKILTKVAVRVINAGQRPAHLRRHKLMFKLDRIDGPNPVVREEEAEPIDETIDHDNPMTFMHPIPPQLLPSELLNGVPEGGTIKIDAVNKFYMDRGQRLFFFGKIEYFDGVDVWWTDWCKYLAGSERWDTCPVHRNR